MSEHTRRTLGVLAAVVTGAMLAGSCSPGSGPTGGGELQGIELEVAGKWTGTEQQNFEEVLSAFEEETGATVSYASTGEDTGAYLGPKIEAGEPPDIAVLPQPGLVQEYADQDALVPLQGAAATALEENYADYWKDLGSVDGDAYGILVKAAHKSIIWYRPDAFGAAGVEPPQTWGELTGTTASTLSDAGITPFSMCGASGWTLTDWFENVYLSQAGPQKYDQLVAHEIAWTDESVVAALERLSEIWGSESFMAGGRKGAVQTDFPACVTDVYGDRKSVV